MKKSGLVEDSNNFSQVTIHVQCFSVAGYKQLLDLVFVISRIIKVELRVSSLSRRPRLITLTETLIILDTKWTC